MHVVVGVLEREKLEKRRRQAQRRHRRNRPLVRLHRAAQKLQRVQRDRVLVPQKPRAQRQERRFHQPEGRLASRSERPVRLLGALLQQQRRRGVARELQREEPRVRAPVRLRERLRERGEEVPRDRLGNRQERRRAPRERLEQSQDAPAVLLAPGERRLLRRAVGPPGGGPRARPKPRRPPRVGVFVAGFAGDVRPGRHAEERGDVGEEPRVGDDERPRRVRAEELDQRLEHRRDAPRVHGATARRGERGSPRPRGRGERGSPRPHTLARPGVGRREGLDLAQRRSPNLRRDAREHVHELGDAPPDELVLLARELAIEQRERLCARARGEHPPVVDAEERREDQRRFPPRRRRAAVQRGDERGEELARELVLGPAEARAVPRARVGEAANQHVERRLLRALTRVAEHTGERLDAVLLHRRPERLGGGAARARERARRGASQLLGARGARDGDQAGHRLGAAESARPLPAVARDVFHRLHRVVLRDLVLALAEHARHRAHGRRGDLPSRGRRRFAVVRGGVRDRPPLGGRGRRLALARRLVLLRGDVEEELPERRHRSAPDAFVLIPQALRQHDHDPRRRELVRDVRRVPE